MRERALVHVGGPLGAGKTTFIERLLDAEVAFAICVRAERVIGDANGADKAVQAYLADREYGAVEVFCVRGNCRNNLGGWRVREVAAPHSRRDFAFYASKDEEMAKDADVGFMIWDGKSFGTLANAFRLIDQGKKVVVIVSSEETSVTTIRSQGDWNRFVSDCAPDLRERLAKIARPTTAATSGEKRAGLF